MENKKLNKLSIVSFILILVGPLLLILDNLRIHLPKADIWGMYILLISPISFVLAIISLIKIKTANEKGKFFSITTILIFIIILLVSIFSNNQAYPGGENAAMKSQLSNIRAQAELYYEFNGSFSNLCDNPKEKSGLGGLSGPGPLKSTSDYSMKGSTKCFSDKDSWVTTSGLLIPSKSNTHYCTDSTGIFEPITSSQNDSIINADTLCPVSLSNSNGESYKFIKDYETLVTVGGFVGVEKKTFNKDSVIVGKETNRGLEIRIAPHSKVNEGEPSNNSYQEFLTIPMEYLSKIK